MHNILVFCDRKRDKKRRDAFSLLACLPVCPSALFRHLFCRLGGETVKTQTPVRHEPRSMSQQRSPSSPRRRACRGFRLLPSIRLFHPLRARPATWLACSPEPAQTRRSSGSTNTSRSDQEISHARRTTQSSLYAPSLPNSSVHSAFLFKSSCDTVGLDDLIDLIKSLKSTIGSRSSSVDTASQVISIASGSPGEQGVTLR